VPIRLSKQSVINPSNPTIFIFTESRLLHDSVKTETCSHDSVKNKRGGFKRCLSVHVDSYTIIVPTKCTSFY
jgi:hypothetical protein